MRYTIDNNEGDETSIVGDFGLGIVWINGVEHTVEQFKEFRRAVGYVWTEIEGKA